MAFRRDLSLGTHGYDLDLTMQINALVQLLVVFQTAELANTSSKTLPLLVVFQTAELANTSYQISTTTGRFSISQAFTCSSSCLIYCIRCTKCGILYIGEICRQLSNLFAEHLRNVGHKDHAGERKIEHSDTNISKHFNSDGHTTDDMAVFGLLFADKDSTKRKTLEKRIICNWGLFCHTDLTKDFRSYPNILV